jgi:hypothetical protein
VHLGVENNFAPARKAHPAFIVEDLAALTAALTRAGCPISYDEPLEGCDRICVHDPFGNRIELLDVKTSRA